VGSACQRLSCHAPCPDWLAGEALPRARAIKASIAACPFRQRRSEAVATLPAFRPRVSERHAASPPGHAPPSTGKVAAPPPFITPPAAAPTPFRHRSPLLRLPAHVTAELCHPRSTEVGRLPRSRLRHLDVASEDPSPCAASSPC
jgi:hypothetical protein